MIGVVIPYFQRKPGLLNRALHSVAAQDGDHRLRVYVVDDGSPIPAEAELTAVPPADPKFPIAHALLQNLRATRVTTDPNSKR